MAMMATGHETIGPINLGNPGEFTMNELAELVLRLTDSSSPTDFLPLPADDPVRRQPDITLAERVLDWKPTTELSEGLKPTIEYFRAVLEQQSHPGIGARG